MPSLYLNCLDTGSAKEAIEPLIAPCFIPRKNTKIFNLHIWYNLQILNSFLELEA